MSNAATFANPTLEHEFMLDETHRAFFLLGHAKSGTNWTCNLLNLHPDINCHGEYHFERMYIGVDRFTFNKNTLGHFEPLKSLTQDFFREFVRACLRTQIEKKPNATWVGDRTPRILTEFLPGAPNMLIVRDGRDVIISLCHHLIRMGGPGVEPYQQRMQPHVDAFVEHPDYFKENPSLLFADLEWLEFLVKRWADRIRDDFEQVKKFQTGEYEGSVHVFRYEDMHADTERGRAELYEYLGLDPAQAAPLSHETKTLPGFKNETPNDFFRKGQVGDWQNYATDDFRRIMKQHAGETLIELGYENNLNW